MNRTTLHIVHIFAFGAVWVGLSAPAHATEDRLTLSLPVQCELGTTCWIPNYVDHKPGKGVLDYTCGDATYDATPGGRHKGTDFAVRSMTAVQKGVPVVAAASGVVLGMRDGVADVFYDKTQKSARNVQNKECGNGVRLQHDNGLVTQYCHMRKGSVLVRSGDRVEREQRLGFVGVSGKAAFAHLHFQVEKNKAVIDPFTGEARQVPCGVGESPLWDAQTLAQLPYQPTAIFHAGFSAQKPDRHSIRQGLYDTATLPATAPAMVLWAEMFRVRAGDEIVMKITNPSGQKIHEQRLSLTKNQAYYYAFSGLRLKTRTWPLGTYGGEIKLLRKDEVFSATHTVEVR